MIRRGLYSAFSLLANREITQLESDSCSPREAQYALLQKILAANVDCQFGREHSFSSLREIRDYQRAVPIREYEQFRPYVDQVANGAHGVLTREQPFMFATTSGTTGKSKYIPITPSYIKEFRSASVASGYHLLRSYPRIAGGVTFSMASPAEEGRTPSGIPYGAISGELFRQEPFLIKKFISPIPYDCFLIKDYEAKYYSLLRVALQMSVSCFYTLNPSTIGIICRRMQQYAPRLIQDIGAGTFNPPADVHPEAKAAMAPWLKPNVKRANFLSKLFEEDKFQPAHIWPDLAVVTCWTKAAAAFYLADFPTFFENVPVSDITYGASEGRGTVFMGNNEQMLALHSHFFEFVPEYDMDSPKPTVLLCDELELGQNYFILFTTSAGLYRYNINDVLKVVGFHNKTPLLEFQYKGGNIHSFTGEKITELQVTAAMAQGAAEAGLRVRFFTVVPVFRPEPHYTLWAELEPDSLHGDRSKILHTLAAKLDAQLSKQNIEYKVKRDSGRLGPVDARLIRTGAYEQLRKQLSASGVADSQIKLSHLNPKTETKSYFSNNLEPSDPQQVPAPILQPTASFPQV